MDEQRLAELFRAAAGEAPPPTFGSDDVIAASRRAAARRRSTIAGGALLGVAVLGGGALAVDRLLPADSDTPAGAGQAAPPQAGADAPDVRPFALPAPPPGPRSAPAAGACGPVDDRLAAQVTSLLAERGIAAQGPAGAAREPCPPGSRATAVPVSGGTLLVLVVPVAGQPEPVDIARPDGGRGYAITLDDGRGLAVIAVPGDAGGRAPHAEQLPGLARELAGRV